MGRETEGLERSGGPGPSAGGRKQEEHEGSGQGLREPGRWVTVLGLCWSWLGMGDPGEGVPPPAGMPPCIPLSPSPPPSPLPCRILGCLAPNKN